MSKFNVSYVIEAESIGAVLAWMSAFTGAAIDDVMVDRVVDE